MRILAVALAAGALGCASIGPPRLADRAPSPSQAAAAAALQRTPAGRAVASWLDAYNSGHSGRLAAAITKLYPPAALERRSARDRATGFRLWWRNYRRLTPVAVDSLTDFAAVVTVRSDLTEGWSTLEIDVDPTPPHGITGVGLLPFREPLDWTEKPVASDRELVARVEALVKRLVNAGAFSGVVLLTRGGRPLFRQGFGFADREARRANTVGTPFELASVGKMFTAVAVTQLAEQGRLSLDATIGSLLPAYPAGQSRTQVTVHDLLTMSSGIPDVFRSPRYWAGRNAIRTLSDYWPFFATAPLEFPPGTQWAYSNSNYLVLGAIVERVAGMPFPAFVEQRIFQKAGMTQTRYRSADSPARARGYSHMPPGSAPGTPPDPDRWYRTNQTDTDEATGSPAGGGISTVDDLAGFAEALMNGQLLGPEMMTRTMTGYMPTEYGGRHGYGLETRSWNHVRILGHGGAFTGVSNQVDFYPELGYVLVVLGNSDASGTQAIANRVRSLIAGSAGRSQSGANRKATLDERGKR